MNKIKGKIKRFILNCLSDNLFLKVQYYRKFKKSLNLKNPKTFNEKIQWLKLNDRTSLHTLCADKLKVRDYIKELLGEKYLIPLVLSTKNIEDITPDNLPNYPVIIKTNHDSGTYFIIKNKEKQNWEEIRAKLSKSLKTNYYSAGREWQYKNIEPFIIVEKLLLINDLKIPQDLKFHCYNGKVKYIQVDFDKETNPHRSLFSVKWELLNFGLRYPSKIIIAKPENLKLLLNLAEKVASKFCFARVDFYELEGHVYFGEITFHPASGLLIFNPEEKDLECGSLLKLPKLIK
ncbi:glycosyl transferase [Tenacibaculum dicentrarchi]|nr:glycosyl transferase [Tenacibaculum dicentrarchi]